MIPGTRELCLTAVGILSILGVAEASVLHSRDEWTEASWASLEPSKELAWVKCYDSVGNYECSRLQVPLNYSDPEGQTAAIALLRIKANVSSDSPEYRGPVLYNPGGPGGSGVDDVLGYGQKLARTVGPQFDIVTFDPRGVSRSTPKVSYFNTSLDRLSWGAEAPSLNLNSSEYVGSLWSRSKIEGQLAGDTLANILPHIQTDHTARDMLRIVEAHGRDKIQYWGISYGTVLGSTFAAMFPDKIERLVIDGVIDVENDYYTANFKDFVLDADETLKWFFKDCHAAGPELCAFYEESPEAIEGRLNRLYDSVKQAPVAVYQNPISRGTIGYDLLRTSILNPGLYFPFLNWAKLAASLAGLEAGNGTLFWQSVSSGTPQNPCDVDPWVEAFANVNDAAVAIRCNDGGIVPSDLADSQKHYEEITQVSEWGSILAAWRIACSHWPEIPKTFFRGPISGNTSHPILLVGNTADPVTPLEAARTVSKGFPGSVVLTMDYAGHSSMFAPSECIENNIRTYFVNGTLPEPGTVCPVDGTAFTNPVPLPANL